MSDITKEEVTDLFEERIEELEADQFESFEFETSSLLYKWGFEDGTLLSEFLREAGFENDPVGLFDSVLVETVREEVLPALDQEVETYVIHTTHNPIRAHQVGDVGTDTSDHPTSRRVNDSTDMAEITPKTVEVSARRVLEIARELCGGDRELPLTPL